MNPFHVVLPACVLATVSFCAAADTLYKCADETGAVHYQSDKCKGMKEVASKAIGTEPIESETGTATAHISSVTNTFLINAKINGKPLVMTLDTGASSTAISEDQAKDFGVICHTQRMIRTPTGTGTACDGVAHTIQIGSITLHNVALVILPIAHTGALLGQSALKQLKVEQSGSTMTLNKY
jgi:clan AA aspartic protease (TIGR02281 family)